MAFEMLEFSKNWKNHQDFPTYEEDEAKVRADLQLLHDETRSGLNRLIAALNAPGAAAALPFQPANGLTAQTVEAAILEVYAAVRDAAAGAIVDGTVTREKLAESLLERIYGGRVWVSMDLPGSQDGPGTDFPIGQLWLRPAFTVDNLALTDWTVSGGTAAADEEGWLVTADGTASELTAVQELGIVGSAGDTVQICLWAGDLDDHLSSLVLRCAGMEFDLSAGGGVYAVTLPADGSLQLAVTGSWPYAEADASFRLQKLTVVNTTAAEAQLTACKALEDWAGFLEGLAPFTTVRLPRKLFVQAHPGQWEQIDHECLPVSRGGIGLDSVDHGALLVGSGADAMQPLEPGAEHSLLQMENGMPAWLTQEQLAIQTGFLRAASGSYVGNGVKGRTVTLPVAPKLLIIFPQTAINVPLVLCSGMTLKGTYYVDRANDTTMSVGYQAYASLDGNTLTFTCDKKTSSMATTPTAELANTTGVTQYWMAIY